MELHWAEGKSQGTSFGTLLVLVYSCNTNALLRVEQVKYSSYRSKLSERPESKLADLILSSCSHECSEQQQ